MLQLLKHEGTNEAVAVRVWVCCKDAVFNATFQGSKIVWVPSPLSAHLPLLECLKTKQRTYEVPTSDFRMHPANRDASCRPLLQAPWCEAVKPTLSCASSAVLLLGLSDKCPFSGFSKIISTCRVLACSVLIHQLLSPTPLLHCACESAGASSCVNPIW